MKTISILYSKATLKYSTFLGEGVDVPLGAPTLTLFWGFEAAGELLASILAAAGEAEASE